MNTSSENHSTSDPDDSQTQESHQAADATTNTDTSTTTSSTSYTSKSTLSSRQSSPNAATTTSNATDSTRASESRSANSTMPDIVVNHEMIADAPIINNPSELDDDGTPFEDARSGNERGWFSSQETSFSRGTNNYREFATPAAPSAETSMDVATSGVVDVVAQNNPCTLRPTAMLIPSSTTTDEDSAAAAGLTPQPSSTSTPSPPRAPASITVATSMTSPMPQFPRPPLRVHKSVPFGVYGGPGTAYPTVLLKRRLAAFPVIVPEGVDPAEPPEIDPAALLAAWEAAEATATCGICQRTTTGERFLGYPACDCPHLHARCALVCALLEAPDEPECPGCRRRLRLHRVGRVKPSGRAGSNRGPFCESWFSVSMVTGLSTSAALLAVSVALLLTLIEPDNRELLTATNHQPLMAGLFCLLGVALLACFLIGWLLDRCTAAAWEVYSSRLQIAYSSDRLTNNCERVLAASLMACTFLEYRATSYPYPKRPSAYVNYICLRQPTNA